MLYRDEVCRDRGYRIADDSLLAVGCCVVVMFVGLLAYAPSSSSLKNTSSDRINLSISAHFILYNHQDIQSLKVK
jgi:hypothetical protein